MALAGLNVAAGKFITPDEILRKDIDFLVNVDTMYHDSLTPTQIEQRFELWEEREVIKKAASDIVFPTNLICCFDVFKFMETTTIKFDVVVCYRFLEHVKRTDILYFIYLISTCLKKGGEVDIIVPSYSLLAEMILNDRPGSPNWEAKDIILTTELLNEPSCPHVSVWTADRLKYFFELEKRFEVISIVDGYDFDGRDIYLRMIAKRV